MEGLTSVGLAEVLNNLNGGEMVLSMSNVWDVLHAADFLGVPAASHVCSVFLVEHLEPCNVFDVELAAKRFNLSKLEEKSHEFALEHL